jgi:hypothetical protein
MKTEHMNPERIPPAIEKPFRKALGHAIRNELDEFREALLALGDEQVLACLSLCAYVTGFVAIDVSGGQWPNEHNRSGIAERATKGVKAREFGLTPEESYAYLVRVALGFEPLDTVFPATTEGNKDAVTLSFVIAGHIMTAFCPVDLEWWEYLTIMEEAYEASASASLALLPALMLRSRRLGSPRVLGGNRDADSPGHVQGNTDK